MRTASVVIRRVGGLSKIMSNVIPFKARVPASAPAPATEIDLLTAVDAAIRDLRDIARGCDASAREQAHECRQMLETAFRAAVVEQ
jgi:hypothetical protein